MSSESRRRALIYEVEIGSRLDFEPTERRELSSAQSPNRRKLSHGLNIEILSPNLGPRVRALADGGKFARGLKSHLPEIPAGALEKRRIRSC
jgi:hypothetical protein